MGAKTFNFKIMMLGVAFAFASVVIISIVIENILPVIEMILFFLTYVT